MVRYSVTQIQNYLQCPLKYRYQYIDKISTGEFVETADTLLWNIVHKSLEFLYNEISILKTPTKEDLIKFYKDLRLEKEKIVQENWWEIQNFNKNLTLDDYKHRWETYLNRYYDKQYPFKDTNVISTEKQISFELDNKINFLWYIDRLDKKWDTFIINDYKTNKTLPTQDKDYYIDQLTLYWLWIQQQYWKYFKTLKARLYFLHFDIEEQRELTDEKLDNIRKKYIEKIYEIEDKKAQYLIWSKKIFEANESPLCTRCDYRNICPLFTPINYDEEIDTELSDKTIKSLVDEFIEINNKISQLENEKENLKSIFLKYIIKKDLNNEKSDYVLTWSTEDIRISKSPKINVVDKEKFIEKIKSLWLFEKYADISRQNVNNLFFKNKDIKLKDFQWTVEEDITYTIRKQNKK